MGSGHVIPNGPRIRQIRLEKGWTPEQLALAKAGERGAEMDVRTVRKAEKCLAIAITSLVLIAKKLAVDHMELLKGQDENSRSAKAGGEGLTVVGQKRRVTIEIELDLPDDASDEDMAKALAKVYKVSKLLDNARIVLERP